MSNYRYIIAEREGELGFITLNRPEVLNALSREMVAEIVNAMDDYERDDEIKVIVLSGAGRAFAAGADIHEMADDDPIRLELLNQFQLWDRLGTVKKPVIAAVHGFALGGGFELALCCDLILASEDAKFGFPEIKLGVMPGAGGTQRLTKLMGRTKALEWLWLGEPMSAKEALHFGIVNRLVAPEVLMEETKKFAKKIAERAPLSVRLIKEAVNKAVDAPLLEGMQFERKNFYLLFASRDQKEGMTAFLEKREPKFEGR